MYLCVHAASCQCSVDILRVTRTEVAFADTSRSGWHKRSRLNAKGKTRHKNSNCQDSNPEKGSRGFTESTDQHPYLSATQMYKRLFLRLQLLPANINMGRILPLSFSWPSAIDRHSFSPKLWCWSFDSRHLLEGVGLLYKRWQIAVLCQARVCVHLGPKLWLRSHVCSQCN